MDSTSGKLSSVAFDVSRSNIYTAWLLEKQEVAKHKWVMSERALGDVGWEAARWDWDMNHRQTWIAEMRERGLWPK